MKKLIFTLLFTLAFAAIFAAAPTKKDFDEWNRLTEDEKMLCLLTEPFLFGRLGLKTSSLNPEPKKNISVSDLALYNGMNINSKRKLYDYIDKYMNGQTGNIADYEKAKALYNKYPAYSVEEISKMECLDLQETCFLFIYAENKNKIGDHGFLVFDAVRALSAIRFGIALNICSEDEAINLAKPIMEQLLNAYDSYEDFASHYWLEQSFFNLLCKYETEDSHRYFKDIIEIFNKKHSNSENSSNSKYAINYDIKFPAHNQNGNPVLTYDDAFYDPSKEAMKWYNIKRLEHRGKDLVMHSAESKAKKDIAEMLDFPAIALSEMIYCVTNNDFDKVPEYLKAFENIENKSDTYQRAYILCGLAYYKSCRNEELMDLIEKNEDEKFCSYLRAFYYTDKFARTVNEKLKKDDTFHEDIETFVPQCEKLANEILNNYFAAKNEFVLGNSPYAGKIQAFFWERDIPNKAVLECDNRIMRSAIGCEACAYSYLFWAYTNCSHDSCVARDYEKGFIYYEKSKEILNKYNNEKNIRLILGDNVYDTLIENLNWVDEIFNVRYVPRN